MKKCLVTILALIYLCTTTGASVHMHYCMGDLIEHSLWANDDQQCGNCGMDKSLEDKEDCCNDEQQQIKVHVDQSNAEVSTIQFLHLHPVILPVPAFQLAGAVLSSITESNPLSNAPPRSASIPVYKRNRAFLI